MGYVDGQNVLDAQRILVANAVTGPEIGVFMEKVGSVSTKSITLAAASDGNPQVVTPDKNTYIGSLLDGKTRAIKLSAISPSDLVIVVSDISGTPVLVRSIFDLGGE